ncbi:conserved hypothetical protein [Theileria equi strain WA]|uniref:Nuclear migration protein nudC n=1 Tax=Theileria equi strain WA TaxID=1537102 RepID=L1LC49_THEEQ|nr:conserved hypothetical protein [Theileria equi strain WA]EKX72916.1 conserved hypothetical protein [Theileria equi strain WA]|eukprot:XP_004832368.1 conserved hypothetical protein [Theileria equi strain WA]
MSNFDELMLLAIKEFKSIEDILQHFFRFLGRHTDFYHTLLNEEEIDKFNLHGSNVNSKGFKPNHMVKLVNHIIQDNLIQYRERYQPYLLNNKPMLHAQVQPKVTKPQEKKQVTKGSTKYTLNPWNGGVTKTYAWAQTISDLTIEIISNEILSTDNVKVSLSRDSLKVVISGNTIIDGQFCNSINATDSMWNIEDRSRIVLSIEKAQELWWDCAIKGDETIDTQNIESVKRIEEFSSSEQREILKLMAENRNKQASNFPF